DHGPASHAPAEPPTPSGVPAPAVPAPAVPVPTGHAAAPPASAEMPPPGAPVPMPAVPVYAGAPAPAPAPGPWQRYDPWAAPAGAGGHGPLQQNGAAVPSTEQRRKRGKRTLVLGAVLLALVSGGIGGVVGTYLERNGGVGSVELPQAGKEAVARDADSVAGIAGRALPSVVTLHVSGAGEQGTGTGFVLDTRGHILTNNHVVQPAGSGGEITVTFNGGQTAQAEVVGRDSGYDLAVVKVKGVSGLTPLPLGNSDNVQVGDPVVAIGAPFDLAGTVTSGIISAKQRPITAGGEKGDGSDVSYVDALQTDAPINPGNSGGPLLDARARVIGINSAIRSADSGSTQDSGRSGSIGLGFAIPINQGKRVAEELINTGRATHPVIGITLDMDYTGDGARVATEGSEGGAPVTAGGPGAKAGIKSGDVITEVDGRRVHSGEELIVKTRAHRPGDRLELTVERGGKERKVSLVLGSSGG
ncbi:trypsin-like peptidase domain-containing protein, partial [Streptomyces sp. NPDC029044]|uniref:S1C family serine protease n=1 Tax=Streptomyces sp. NPDC029044 TaxID=3157198 RepID=UPI0033DE6EAF